MCNEFHKMINTNKLFGTKSYENQQFKQNFELKKIKKSKFTNFIKIWKFAHKNMQKTWKSSNQTRYLGHKKIKKKTKQWGHKDRNKTTKIININVI